MKHLFTYRLFVLGFVATLGASAARAELIDFSYEWTATPAAVSGGTGSVSLTPYAKGTSEYDTTGTQTPFIKGLEVTSTGTPTDTKPDVYPDPTKPNSNKFQLGLTLTDAASGKTGTLIFGGTVSGNVYSSSGGTNQATSKFDGDVVQSIQLGSHFYTVAIDPFALVPFVGSTDTGLISAQVIASSVDGTPPPTTTGGPPVTNTPEPSSLVLGGMALAGLAARRWSRLKQKAI